MRQYLFGVLIIILGVFNSGVFCDNSNEYEENRNSFYVAGVNSDDVNERDTSSESISYEENDYDVYNNENSDEKKYTNGYFGEDVSRDYETDTYRPVDENVAYWESIYGTDDVPDFEVPPPIDGDSIFMDLGDLTDSWDEENDEEVIPVKRDAGKPGSHIGRTSSSVKEIRNFENSDNLDYHSMMTNIHQPHFYEENSWQGPKTSTTYQNVENGQFHGSKSSSRTASFSNLAQQESSWTSKNSRRSESRSNSIAKAQDIDSEMENTGLEFANQFPSVVESRSIKSSGMAESLMHSKQKVIQAKKDLINVAVAGGSKAEVNHAVHKMIDAKKDLIDSVTSGHSRGAEVNHAVHKIIDAKKDLIDSMTSGHGSRAETNHAVHKMINAKKDLIDSVISGHGSRADVNHAVHKIIDTKKDLIDSVTSGHGSRAELNHAAHKIINAKKDLIDSVITGHGSQADVNHAVHKIIDAKKDLIESVTSGHGSRAETNHAVHKMINAKKDLIDSVTSGHGSRAELNHAAHKIINAKKDLIDSVITGHGSQADVNHAVHKIIDAKKDLIDSVTSGHGSRAETNHAVDKMINAKKDLIDSVISGHGNGADVNHAVHKIIDTKKDLIDSMISRHGGGAEVNHAAHKMINAKKDLIDSVTSGHGNRAEVNNAIHRTIEAKKDLIDSVISAKSNTIQRKKEFTHSTNSGINHSHRYSGNRKISGSRHSYGSFQSVLDSKQKVIQAKKDLIHASAVGSKAEMSEAVIKTLDAKKDLVDSVISTKAKIFNDKKEFGHSTCAARNTMTHFINGAHKNGGTSLNENSHVSGPIYFNFPNNDIAIGGEIGVAGSLDINHHKKDGALNINNKIQSSGQISSDLEIGSITHQSGGNKLASLGKINLDNSRSSEIDTSSGITTIHNQKDSHHSSVSGTSHIEIGGEIGVGTSSGHHNYNQDSSLNLNKKIQNSGEIFDEINFGEVTDKDGTDSLTNSGEINLSHSGRTEIDTSSGITKIYNEKSSHDSSLSGASHIEIEGGIGVANSFGHSNYNHDNSLKLNKKIENSGEISREINFGEIRDEYGADSLENSDKINLSHSVNSEIDTSSGITTIHDKKSSHHSSLSGASHIEIEGGHGVANSFGHSNYNHDNSLKLSKKIENSGEISREINFGEIRDEYEADSLENSGKINLSHSVSSEIDTSSGITTIHDKKNSHHSSSSGASHIEIEGGIGVGNSISHHNHNHDSSLKLSKEIKNSDESFSDINFGEITDQDKVEPLTSSGKINLAHSGSSEIDISSAGITSIHNEKSSHQSSLSGTSHIEIGGEIGVANSFSHSNHKQDSSLNLNKKFQSSGQISSDLHLGSITSKNELHSGKSSDQIHLATTGNIETKLSTDTKSGTTNIVSDVEPKMTTYDSNSSSEEIRDSDLTENQSSSEFLNTKYASQSEVSKNIESKSSISSGIALDTNLNHGEFLDSGIKIKGAISSDVSTQFNTDKEITDIGHKDNSKSIHKECALGLCGISGKLHVDSNTNSKSRLDEEDEEIPEVNIQSPIIETFIINTEDAGYEPKEHLGYEDDFTKSEANEDDKAIEDVIERPSDVDDHVLIHNERDHQPKIISITKNVEFGDDESRSSLNEPENVFGTNEGTHQVHKHLENNENSISFEKSLNSVIQSEISLGHETGLQSKEDGKGALDMNGQYQISLKIDDLNDNSNNEHHSSTYEQKFGKHYSNAAHQHQESQRNGEISHYQCFAGSSHALLPEDVELYKTDGTFTNAHCRLINLDVNCSGMTAFMRPECQQLNTRLWHPQDSDRPITLWTVKTYLSHGQELAIEMQNRAKWLCDKGLVPKLHTPAMLHLINNLATINTVEINQESEFSLFGVKLLQRRLSSDFDVTPNTFIEFLKHHAFRVIGTGMCHVRPKRCKFNQIYRSFDGSCNNQNHPTWGQCNTAFSRILPARYFDGVHEPPRSVTGIELPNPRLLSVHCFSRRSITNAKISLAFSQWGQILSHDFALQTIDQTVEGGIQCCAEGKHQLPKNLQHHSCLPIDIPADDKFYSKFESRCMNFVRSMTISREDCTLGPADQLNTVTSYLDASPLYGSDKETCDQLRAFKGGRMLVSVRRGRELLPTMTNRSRFCDVMSPSEVCYLAGDVRVNQNPQLAILQTSLLREHNRIADELTILNPHWDDERVFQEARKIVIAEYQHITYHEWLPLVIGKKYCQRHRLTLRCQDKMSRDYDPRIKAATINSFTTAVFRLFHSMVDGNINLCPANREISHILRLSNHYFRPQIIERSNNLDDLIRGLVSQPMQQADVNFHPEITEYLFRSRNEFGMDLEALDIQRGRDHGLPSYNSYRKTCGLVKAKNFDDLYREIPLESIEKLKRLYAHVDDIDLIVGAALENKSPGSLLGPVARCLIGEQFYRSRIGDRYFYDNADQPHSFTQEQFEEIKKASFARLLCDTGDNIQHIQPQAFKMISSRNPLTCCCDLPKIDLSLWQE